MPDRNSPAENLLSQVQFPLGASKTLSALHKAGHEAYFVGGCVRDLLLGLQPKDFDIATAATPAQIRLAYPNCRLIGRRFPIMHLYHDREIIEVATFRGAQANVRQGYRFKHSPAGMIVRDRNYGGNLAQDASRRDFTVNALYWSPHDCLIRDFQGGLADIQLRILRTIGEPESRYREDPVRMLRAARLAAKLGFHLDADSHAIVPVMAGALRSVSPRRLADELRKVFLTGHAASSLRVMRALGLFEALFPDVDQLATRLDRKLLHLAITSCDQNVSDGQPQQLAFLLAAILWPLCASCYELFTSRTGADPGAIVMDVLRDAHFLPRRILFAISAIWMRQPPYTYLDLAGSRARLAEQDEFAAVLDFLVLRDSCGERWQDPEPARVAAWWRGQRATHRARSEEKKPGLRHQQRDKYKRYSRNRPVSRTYRHRRH